MASNNKLSGRNSNRGSNQGIREKLRVQKEKTEIRLRRHVTYTLLCIFGVNTLSVLAIIFLNGLGVMHTDIRVILSLIGETMAHGAGLFYLVTRYLFPGKSD